MKLDLTTGLIGAGILVAGGIAGGIAGFLLQAQPRVGTPYPNDSNCSAVAWNSSTSKANTYTIVFNPPSSGPPSITATVDFTWDTTPGFHHNVAVPPNPPNQVLDIVQDPCTGTGTLAFKLHPPSSNPNLADPVKEDDWSWDTSRGTVTVTRSDSGAVPVGYHGAPTTP